MRANLEAANGFKDTLLHMASSVGDEAVVRMLVDRGANLEAADWRNQTPIHSAEWYGHYNVARVIRKKLLCMEDVQAVLTLLTHLTSLNHCIE